MADGLAVGLTELLDEISSAAEASTPSPTRTATG